MFMSDNGVGCFPHSPPVAFLSHLTHNGVPHRRFGNSSVEAVVGCVSAKQIWVPTLPDLCL